MAEPKSAMLKSKQDHGLGKLTTGVAFLSETPGKGSITDASVAGTTLMMMQDKPRDGIDSQLENNMVTASEMDVKTDALNGN